MITIRIMQLCVRKAETDDMHVYDVLVLCTGRPIWQKMKMGYFNTVVKCHHKFFITAQDTPVPVSQTNV